MIILGKSGAGQTRGPAFLQGFLSLPYFQQWMNTFTIREHSAYIVNTDPWEEKAVKVKVTKQP